MFPGLVRSVTFQANIPASMGRVTGCIIQMTAWYTHYYDHEEASADTFGDGGGVTTFTNSSFIWFLLLLQMYANAEVFIFLLLSTFFLLCDFKPIIYFSALVA